MPTTPNQQDGVYVVILNWNGWKDTIECLESLFRIDYPQYRVVVCDNGSHDGSLEFIKAWAQGNRLAISSQEALRHLTAPPVPKPIQYVEYDRAEAEMGGSRIADETPLVLIRTGENLGFAGGNNVGLRYALARGDMAYAWLLNNDTVVNPSALAEMVKRISSSPRIGMCGSVLRFFDRPEMVQVVGGVRFNFWLARGEQLGQGLRDRDPAVSELAKCEPDYIAGASLLVSRDFLQDVGLMEESYFLYFEEIDWAMRARPRWALATAGDSVVYHKEGGSIGTSSRNRRSALSQYYLNRNLLRFYAKRLPILCPIAFARTIREAISQLLKRDRELAKVTIKAVMAAVIGERGKSTWL